MKIYLEELKKLILQKAFAGELTNSEGMIYSNDGINVPPFQGFSFFDGFAYSMD
ncbi:hypothetical protein QUH73_18300 [Labilibaculum sp. K2S]|uniref:hypothetical protein n=1 Tax=Labilibaculum sp. K2S TaxID=3056386 RepID=UPI0025A4BC3B|nr:hypothetical protein [Labilibaculum sp. K2S]MDM8161775.1 hypothetical protein [Labilibaculum sp. K2S]